ncbi:MAG: GntR family transcriptional regulator [Simplicispira sp.]|nr:GntR family transcriptional regulator [Simplicispira sp.]
MAKRTFLAPLSANGEPLALLGGGSRTLTEQTYNTLRDDIIEGRLAPGSKLRIEHLRTQYGVGAGTVREALTRLVSDALVRAEGQRGFRVAPIAMADLQDLTALRVQIETEALRQSIRLGGEAWRRELCASYEAISALEQPIAPAHRRQWEALNVRFHEALLAGHGSAWTSKVLRVLSRHSERYRCYAIGLPGMARDVHAEHTEIFELALAGREARAALALEAHICATPHLLLQALREGQLVLPGEGALPD